MILWVRHGQSTWNAANRMHGDTLHPPLTELGRRQAGQAANALAGVNVAAVLSSPAIRAQQTAAVIAERLGLEVRTDALLAEKGLDEPVARVLGRIQEFLRQELPGTVVAVSHGDTIGLAVGMLAGQKPVLPSHCDVIAVDPHSHEVTVTGAGI